MNIHNTPIAELERRLAQALGVDEAVIRAIEFGPMSGLRKLNPDTTKIRAELRIVISERYAPDGQGSLLG